nr:hypothetical protein [Tanacetum cinerariifolium]
MNCIEKIAKDAKVIEIYNQLPVLIKRQVETELMLEEKFRDLCEEVSNFVEEIKDVVKEAERLSCKDVAKETVCVHKSVRLGMSVPSTKTPLLLWLCPKRHFFPTIPCALKAKDP